MEKKQTAVELLEEQYYESEGKLTRHDFDQAKQMEKEQMIEFIKKAPIKTGLLREPDIYYIIDAESHYNETYGGQDESK
jgi:hypothetical protein